MIPAVSLALSVEMLRDGGSLCASFQGANGSVYWLVLPIRLYGDDVGTYDPPVVVERPFAPVEMQVSWSHAKTILRQVEQSLPHEATWDWVEPMYACIEMQGNWRHCAS